MVTEIVALPWVSFAPVNDSESFVFLYVFFSSTDDRLEGAKENSDKSIVLRRDDSLTERQLCRRKSNRNRFFVLLRALTAS